jgi:hypothetical protein
MKTNSMILALVSSLSLTAVAHAQEASAPTRGSVAVRAQGAKAIVAGPIAIRAYSQFSGAKLFVVAAVSGTDGDCAGAHSGAVASLAADRTQTFMVGAGQLACVETTAPRGSELLWHAQTDRVAGSPVLLASSR